MTLGLILETPDGARIAASNCTEYHALPLADSRFDSVRAAMHDGIRAGVFVPQLHGQCHYWPPAVLAAALADDSVRDWLTAPELAATEDLPSPLQSRWVDASSLPSCALAPEAIQQAATAESAAYQAVFGSAPQAAVAQHCRHGALEHQVRKQRHHDEAPSLPRIDLLALGQSGRVGSVGMMLHERG